MPLRRSRTLAPWAAQRAVFLLVGLLLGANRAAARNSSPSANTPSSRITAELAIADFDGDRRPDVATVETGTRNLAGDTRYSIHFQLASGSAQAFGVVAPAGGLQIVAQDVNGDNALDLLVSTAWQHKQVAVFLNDGHGNFSPVDPSAFSAIGADTKSQWNGKTPFVEAGSMVRFENGPNGCEIARRFATQPPSACKVAAPEPISAQKLFAVSVLGRAPPCGVLPA